MTIRQIDYDGLESEDDAIRLLRDRIKSEKLGATSSAYYIILNVGLQKLSDIIKLIDGDTFVVSSLIGQILNYSNKNF